MNTIILSLVEIAFSHGNMQANFLQNMENAGSMHGKIL